MDKPFSKKDYPQSWLSWENEVLAPFLNEDPDMITLTAYQVCDVPEAKISDMRGFLRGINTDIDRGEDRI